MLNPKEVLVRNIGIYDEEESAIIKVIKVRLCKEIRFESATVIGGSLLAKWRATGITGEKRSSCKSSMWQRVVQLWLFPIPDSFDCHVTPYFSRRGFAFVNDVYRATDWSIGLEGYNIKRNAYPWSLIFPHDFKLASHNRKLINGGSSEYKGEYCKTPIGETATFRQFAKSHRVLLFIVSLGFSCCGTFFLLFGGYCFAIQGLYLRKLLLCVSLGVLSFAFVFALAHASYR